MNFHRRHHPAAAPESPLGPLPPSPSITRSSQPPGRAACFWMFLYLARLTRHHVGGLRPHGRRVMMVCSFSKAYAVPRCKYTTLHTSVLCWETSGWFPVWGLSWMRLLETFRYTICGERLHVFCCLSLGVEQLGRRVGVVGRCCPKRFRRGRFTLTPAPGACGCPCRSTSSPAVRGVCPPAPTLPVAI